MRVLLTLFLCCVGLTVQAKETISVVWGFSLGSNTTQNVRLLIDELNAIQNRYDFVFVHKPGAGGTLAANFVADNPNSAVVAMSSSFIIRPLFERQEPTHKLDDFRPILVQGNGTPLVYVSSKFNNLQQVLNSTQPLTVGVSGVGSVSHLATTALSGAGIHITIVNFKHQQEASTAAAGGHVDLAVGFLSDLQPLLDAGRVRVIGYTGKADIPGYAGLQLERQGIKDAGNLTANYAVYASTRMAADKYQDIHNLMARALTSPTVRQNMAKDMINIPSFNREQSMEWYASQRSFWQRQVTKLTGEK